jgi:hypothetical protein
VVNLQLAHQLWQSCTISEPTLTITIASPANPPELGLACAVGTETVPFLIWYCTIKKVKQIKNVGRCVNYGASADVELELYNFVW